MERRTLLTLLTTGAVTTAGCTSGIRLNSGNSADNGGTDMEEYERCGDYIIHVDSLLNSAKDEAIGAIEDDQYETEGELLLPKIVDVNESYLSRRESSESVYYEMSVETDGDVTHLQAEETVPETNAVSVVNWSEADLTLDVRIEHEEDLLVKQTGDIDAGEDVRFNENAEYRYGQYRAEVKVRNNEKFEDKEFTWGVNSGNFQADIMINSDKINLKQPVADSESCKWNRDGELVSGLRDT